MVAKFLRSAHDVIHTHSRTQRSPVTLALLMALAIGVVVSSGCSTFSTTGSQRELLQQVAVQAATRQLITRDADAQRINTRAHRVLAVATEAQTWLDADTTVDEMAQRAVERVNALPDLTPEEREAAYLLITLIHNELQYQISSGLLPDDTRVSVTQVLKWAANVAMAYAL